MACVVLGLAWVVIPEVFGWLESLFSKMARSGFLLINVFAAVGLFTGKVRWLRNMIWIEKEWW